MKIFLTGGTGVAGRSLVPLLVAAGHDVRAVCRREEAVASLREAGVEPVSADLFDSDAVERAVVGTEAVIHLATNVPLMSKAARPRGWDTHNRLRVDATRSLVAAARAAGAQRFVKESITFVYRDAGDAWIDEDAPLLDRLGLMEPTIEGEQLALEFAADGGVATVLRFGLFYGGIGNRGTDDALKLAKFRRSAIAGGADTYMSSIHCDDVASSVVAALGAETGIYNVTDDRPVTRGEYLDAFARAFGIKTPKPTPARLVKLAGGPAADALIGSQRVSNRKFRAATGWAPTYPDVSVGWAAEARSRGERA